MSNRTHFLASPPETEGWGAHGITEYQTDIINRNRFININYP